MTPPVFTILKLSGHIIDSLTLAKVIDTIQAAGCQYQINDLQIGQMKNDVSRAQLSVWADDPAVLEALLLELKAYGAMPVADSPVQVAACPEDGVLPEGAYVRLNPPIDVLYQDTWLSVARQGVDLTIVLDPATLTARLETVSGVKQGDLVVIGNAGVKILPTLGGKAHVQPVAR